MTTTALLLNAGARRGGGVAGRVEALRQARLEAPQVTTYDVGVGQDLPAAIDHALSSAPDLLVVGGGDGTVSCAAIRVAGTGTGTTLGVLPLGTANDFARTLEVPTDLAGAVATHALHVVVPQGSRAAGLDGTASGTAAAG